MSTDEFGSTFRLIHISGERLFPVRSRIGDTARIAFRLSQGDIGGNTKAVGIEEDDEFTVYRLVVKEGWAVRAASRDGKTQGLYKLNQRSIVTHEDL